MATSLKFAQGEGVRLGELRLNERAETFHTAYKHFLPANTLKCTAATEAKTDCPMCVTFQVPKNKPRRLHRTMDLNPGFPQINFKEIESRIMFPVLTKDGKLATYSMTGRQLARWGPSPLVELMKSVQFRPPPPSLKYRTMDLE